MAIIFHCDHCGRKIEASDNTGGKWGKCPSCHNKIYVPNLNIDDDLKLMRKHSAPEVQVKAAGGVGTLDALLRVKDIGVTRIGTGQTAQILEDAIVRYN